MRPWWLGAALGGAHVTGLIAESGSERRNDAARPAANFAVPASLQLIPPPTPQYPQHHHGETFISRLLPISIIPPPGAARVLTAPQAVAFPRFAARTLCAPAHSVFEPRAHFCLVFVRRYASSKKKKMPPKKAPVEQKVLLGRPGNNLKSGIVCRQPPTLRLCKVLTLTVISGRSRQRRQVHALPSHHQVPPR